MTEFVLDGFSCRAEGSGDVLVMLFSGFDEQLFRGVCGLVQDCRCVLAEFGEIDWDRDYSPWEASSGGRRFSGGGGSPPCHIYNFIYPCIFCCLIDTGIINTAAYIYTNILLFFFI